MRARRDASAIALVMLGLVPTMSEKLYLALSPLYPELSPQVLVPFLDIRRIAHHKETTIWSIVNP